MPEDARSTAEWLTAMAAMRNDLEPPARAHEPMIETVSNALRDAGAALVRMSGSGATCFGLFTGMKSAERAAETISAGHPRWYVQATRTAGKSG